MAQSFIKQLAVILTVTIIFLLSACGSEQKSQKNATKVKTEIEIIDPWIRMMPANIQNTAAFMTIHNNTDKPLILKDVSLDWANMAMIHQSKVVDGMATMQHQDQLQIVDRLEFKPGGLHIMIMGLKQPLDPDKQYNILLHFADREPLAVVFKVGQASK